MCVNDYTTQGWAIAIDSNLGLQKFHFQPENRLVKHMLTQEQRSSGQSCETERVVKPTAAVMVPDLLPSLDSWQIDVCKLDRTEGERRIPVGWTSCKTFIALAMMFYAASQNNLKA